MPVEVEAVNHAQLTPQRQTAQMQMASIEGARIYARPSERFSFDACFALRKNMGYTFLTLRSVINGIRQR